MQDELDANMPKLKQKQRQLTLAGVYELEPLFHNGKKMVALRKGNVVVPLVSVGVSINTEFNWKELQSHHT